MAKRLYLRELEALCTKYGLLVEQHEQLRTFTFFDSDGFQVVAINPVSRQPIFRLNDLDIADWECLVVSAKKELEKQKTDHELSVLKRM